MLSDDDFMARALSLAEKGLGHTRPNPPVGAVIVRNGRIIGEGYHHRAGQLHAEVMAIRNAMHHHQARALVGATLYVTLEPCSRAGRVGPCTQAIVESRLGRVVYGSADPNPVNRRRAARQLAVHGIVCDRFRSPALSSRLAALIAPFAKYIATGLPYVTVKLAMSLDGRICDEKGNAKWISSAAARRATGKLREQVDAIMVGAETVRRDNPSLLSHGRRNDDLIRVVISRSGRLPRASQIFTDGRNETLVFKSVQSALNELGRRGALHVLCEGGLKLATSLAAAGLVDEWLTVLTPKVIGLQPLAKAASIAKFRVMEDR